MNVFGGFFYPPPTAEQHFLGFLGVGKSAMWLLYVYMIYMYYYDV